MTTPPSVKDIFNEAVERPAEERQAFLDRACGSDQGLRAQVDDLLTVHDSSGDFLAAPTHVAPYLGAEGAAASLPGSEGPGTVIGRYRILETIGEGGFGTVYMAEQQEPVRRMVALKIIKLGMDTKQIIARFEAERQALAMMEHPNIARVLDAGATETGRPYFVMELVKGIPIGEYCDEESLSTNQRLELFVQVCQAVQHAHQKGIIHRDIKPSNVMVTLHDGKPVPKVIDFGIAKATNARLTEKTLFTEYRQLIGTPEYMSPEQAEMSDLDIDTRSDIYSLGVLLYELLTGTTPFDSRQLRRGGYGEIQRIICEQEPPKPSTRLSSMVTARQRAARAQGVEDGSSDGDSTCLPDIARNRRTDPASLTRSLRGDLDWIVMKAMEKDRTRRYETANELAQDVRRHLLDEPVTASPPSASYRFHKMVRRNRGKVVAASLVMASLVLGIAGTSFGMVRAVRAERLAEEKAYVAETVNEFLNRDLLSMVRPRADGGPDGTVMVRYMLDVAAERIELACLEGGRFANEPLVEASIRGTLGETYRLLGEYDQAVPQARRAVEICTTVLGDDDPKSLSAMKCLATVFACDGRFDEAVPLIVKSVKIELRAPNADHPAMLASLDRLNAVLAIDGRQAEAIALYKRAITSAREALGDKHPTTIRMIDEYNRMKWTPKAPHADPEE